MTRIALVQPPHAYDGSFNCLPTFQVGLGMLSLKAYLEQHGHTVHLFHMAWALLDGKPVEEAFERIIAFSPDLIGIALNWLHFSEGAVETCGRLKEQLPGVPVILGGQHASLFSEDLVQQAGHLFDALLVGEAEIGMLQAAERVAAHESVDHTISGAMVLAPDGSIRQSPPELVDDLDSLPFFFIEDIWPEYPSLFVGAPESVKAYLLGFRPRAALDTVRGVCPKDCSYCIASHIGAIQGRDTLVAHSPEWLVEHIEQFVARGINAITIQDPFFILGDAGLVALGEGILSRGLDKKLVAFDIFVEPGAYSLDAMALFSRVAKMVMIEFGVETGSPKVATAMGRISDYERILENMVEARQAGLIPLSWWMVGLPDEGAPEIEETMRFIERSMAGGILPAQVSPMVLFPQTRLAREASRWGIRQKFKNFQDFARFSREPVHEEGVYPALVTHETDRQSSADTIRHVQEIRRQFQRCWPSLVAVYQGTPLVGFLERAQTLLKYRFY